MIILVFSLYVFVFSVIIELANQRQELWDKMLEMENRASDPHRLFQNRGGQLLLEEKERRNIGKVIQSCAHLK